MSDIELVLESEPLELVIADESLRLDITQTVLDIPTPDTVGQVLYARLATVFTVETPLTSSAGWLVGASGVLLIVG